MLSVPAPACQELAGGWYLRHFVKGQESSGGDVRACLGMKVQPVRQIGRLGSGPREAGGWKPEVNTARSETRDGHNRVLP